MICLKSAAESPVRVVSDQADLFLEVQDTAACEVVPDVIVLRRFVASSGLIHLIEQLATIAPFRHMRTPGGGRMSVAITNCGAVGWVSDTRGYRYSETDPESSAPWPPMPRPFLTLAQQAAAVAGFGIFEPDCCLINRYAVGAQMGTHRDHDEKDMGHPIVSVSIGLPAVFVWYGATRAGSGVPVRLQDGDVIVFGRTARRGFHGVRRLSPRVLGTTQGVRYNLTFRRAC